MKYATFRYDTVEVENSGETIIPSQSIASSGQ